MPPSAAFEAWLGSLRFKFMRALERLRSVLRTPAFMAAAAASECGECEDGEGGDAATPLFTGDSMRDVEGERDGGSEFKSGMLRPGSAAPVTAGSGVVLTCGGLGIKMT